jgi:hypothetical protein
MAHACNPGYLEAEIRKTEIQGQPSQIIPEAPSPKQPEHEVWGLRDQDLIYVKV